MFVGKATCYMKYEELLEHYPNAKRFLGRQLPNMPNPGAGPAQTNLANQ